MNDLQGRVSAQDVCTAQEIQRGFAERLHAQQLAAAGAGQQIGGLIPLSFSHRMQIIDIASRLSPPHAVKLIEYAKAIEAYLVGKPGS